MQIRLMRESGVSVEDAAEYHGVSVWVAFRELRKLRKKLGPEKFKGPLADKARQRARSQTFVNNASSQNTTPNTQQ